MPSPGEMLAGRYQLIQQIGAGGMATVWRARDTRLRRNVAIKLLRPALAEDEDLARRFASEARHAASLSHPNVATVYDTDIDQGRAFIVMELVDGPSVADAIASRGPIEPRVAVEVASSAARALAAAHRRGLIHRDVKPANLLIGRDGRVRLADFGIARALTASRVTTPGTVLGSIPYLSPEQARGDEATTAGDIFSLGVVLFEMLTGRLPWEADTPAAMATVRLHVPAPMPSAVMGTLPAGLDSIVQRALAIDPEDRFPSARMFADALEAWNREHRRRGRRSIVGATTALAAQVAPAAAGGLQPNLAGAAPVSGSASGRAATSSVKAAANPNPWALPPPARGRTRKATSDPVPAAARSGAARSGAARSGAARSGAARLPASATAGTAVVAADRGESERSAGERRSSLLLALLALGFLFVVAAAMVFGGAGDDALRGADTPPIGPSPSAAPTMPAAVDSPSPTGSPAPTLEPTATPTPLPTSTPAPTAQPTPRPTPRETARPPEASAPAAAVREFYDAVEDHDWATAIDLWSPSMQERYPVQEWLIDRFERTTRIDITSLRTISIDDDAGRARVAVTLVEYRTVEPSPRTFDGAWDLVRLDGRWVLQNPYF